MPAYRKKSVVKFSPLQVNFLIVELGKKANLRAHVKNTLIKLIDLV